MKILKAAKVFLEKLITKIISVFKKKEEPLAESVENTVAGYAKTASDLMIREYENLIKRDDKDNHTEVPKPDKIFDPPLVDYNVELKKKVKGGSEPLFKSCRVEQLSMKKGKPSIREKYVIMNGKRFLGYVTSKQKLFGILSYDFSTNPKRHISFNTKEEAFKFMVDEYRTCFNKMWNIDSMFRQPINGYNQAQGMQLIRYYIKQLNNSKIGTILVCDINGCNGDFDGDTLSTYNVH